jgi:hydroxyacylglutathione hydrolase
VGAEAGAVFVVVDELLDLVRAARGAIRVFADRERTKRHRHHIDCQKLSDESVTEPEQHLDCFRGLDGSDETRDNTEHAAFRTTRNEVGRRRIAKETAITRPVWRAEHRRLALEPIDASIHVRNSEQHRRVVHQIARRKIVGAVDDKIVALRDLERILRRQTSIVRFDENVRVHIAKSFARRVDLPAADRCRAVDDLSLEIGKVDDIEIDETESADARSGEVQSNRGSQATSPHQEHTRRFQLSLAGLANLRQQYVSTVANELFPIESTAASSILGFNIHGILRSDFVCSNYWTLTLVRPSSNAPSFGQSMLFKRFYDDNLAQASFLIGCERTREAVVVDPNLDVAQYVRAAGAERLRIAHVTETHVHADFVSGARALATTAGATLHLSGEGPKEWRYSTEALASAHALSDGDDISFGSVRLRASHTPGHTPEHMSFFVSDLTRGEEPVGALTGDFIFVGDVGRPDLLERAVGASGSMESSAASLYDSIQKFLLQPDHLQIWPGHGAGSACGRSLGSMPQTTLGYERLFNWALAQMDKSEFVRRVLEDQPFPPAYFARMKKINRDADAIAQPSGRPIERTLEDLVQALGRGAVVVDTRTAARFAASHIPGTINIPNNKSFLNWSGALVPDGSEVYLITDSESADATQLLVSDLAKIGIDGVRGYFSGKILQAFKASHNGSDGREATLEKVAQVDPGTLRSLAGDSPVKVIDVRGPDEWSHGHLPSAIHIPLAALPQKLTELDPTQPVVVHCKGGGRSSIAASFLKAHGIQNVSSLRGGFEAWVKEGFDVVTESTTSEIATTGKA